MKTLVAAPKKAPQASSHPGLALYIAMNLLDRRLAAHLTQKQLAAKAKVSLRRLVSIESAGTTNVTILTLSRLADVLGVKVQDLLKERHDYVRV